MDIAIISSIKDQASINIKENLLQGFPFKVSKTNYKGNYVYHINFGELIVYIYTLDSELIYSDNLEREISADQFIFISKHKSKDERPSLTCHHIGNFGKAEYGGKDGILCPSNPFLSKKILFALSEFSSGTDYLCTMEATHHGPSINKPVCFVELGSTPRNWEDKEGGYLVAHSLISGIKEYFLTNGNPGADNYEKVIVVGGSHYNHAANKAMIKSNLAVGHICPKHNIEKVDFQMLKTAMGLSNANSVLIDWKGLGKEKRRILELLVNNKIKFLRSDRI